MLHRLPLARRRSTTLAAHRLVAVFATLGLILVGIVAVPVAPAVAAEVGNLPVSVEAPSPILAGEDGSFTLEVRNQGGDRFNLAFAVAVPVGLTPGQATTARGEVVGAPRVVAPGGLGVGQPPAGTQLWVWEDISDLPAGATASLVVPFAPEPLVFPVGATIEIEAAAHSSSDARFNPVFDGSTGVGGSDAEAATASSPVVDAEIKVSALRLEKEQLTYAENELLRGVHEQGAVYRLRVTNTNQGPTQNHSIADLEVVDWLPAGLEFLGCGGAGIDNSTHDWSGAGDGEYAGAGTLGAAQTATVPCPTPDSVATVEATADDAAHYGVVAGRVYTRVTWSLANLTAGETRDIHYVAAVPLLENTLDWSNATDGEAPIAASGEQGANLDNNTGPSTRHGSAASHEDGDGWTNAARAQGYYDGPVVPGTDRVVWDTDTETITAMDLAIVKTVDRDDFEHADHAWYTLTVSTSEYASSSDITVTDTIPDGMCLVANDSSTNCLAAGGAVFGDWTVENVVLDPSDGSRTVTFRHGLTGLLPNQSVTLEYPVYMGVTYEQSAWGPTTSGDAFTNTVEITGTTTLLSGVSSRLDDQGPWQVWDDSAAGLSAPFTTISKRVLTRDALPAGGCEAVAPGSAAWQSSSADDFRLGDTVCYLLTVNFPDEVDTRNPAVADVLPHGIELGGWVAGSGSPVVSAPDVSGQSLTWLVGETAGTTDRIVERGATLHLYVWGTVTREAVGAVVDKPENLMKYRQENVNGEVFFLRDQAETEILPPPLSLLKGVRDVDGESSRPANPANPASGNAFGSNRDGIFVVNDEVITYRIDLTADYPVHDAVVWDLLPAVLNTITDAADVASLLALPAGVSLEKGSAVGLTGANANRWVVVWEGVEVSDLVAGEYRETLTYSLKVTPAMAEVGTSHTNTASVISYEADVNAGGARQEYFPSDGPAYTGRPPAAERVPAQSGRSTTDPSHVTVANVTVAKAVSSPLGTNNSGPAHPVTAANTQVAIGEWATYTYSVTVPANTTVINGALRDVLPTPVGMTVDSAWEVDTTKTLFTGPLSGFGSNNATGELTFPGIYTAPAVDQTWTVSLTARIRPGVSWTHAPTTNRTNTASFLSSGTTKGSRTAGTRVIEPNPQITKVADDDTIVAGQTVTYTLTASNTNGRPTSFDTVVVDCVPAGLQVLGTTPTAGVTVETDSAACAGTGTLITWSVGDLAAQGATGIQPGEVASSQSLYYEVEIDPAAGGGVRYDNTARITGYSVPDDRTDPGQPDPRRSYTRTSTERITAISPTIVKAVDGAASTNAVVGEIVDYSVLVTVPADINLYDTTVVDVVPAGIVISSVDVAYGGPWAPTPTATPSVTDQTITLDLGDVTSATAPRTVTITYRGTVTAASTASNGATFENTASLSWNGVNDDATTRTPIDDDATVTVREPNLTITKRVDHSDTTPAAQHGISVDAGGGFHYRVVVTNTGTSPAYDVEIVDTVPAGVVVGPGSISPTGTLGAVDPVTGERTITWTLSSLAVGANQVFAYSGSLASSSTLDGSALRNVADVTEYFSHPGDPTGEDYANTDRRRYQGPEDDASVTPLFPEPTITKTVDPATTALGEAVGFEIVVTNDGDSPLTTYEVVDQLPAGWTVSDVTPAAGSQTGTVATGLRLVWEGGPLAAGASTTITYDATPDSGHAWTAADLGLDVDHTNTVRVTGTDGSGAPGHLDPVTGDPVPYEDDDVADVNVPLADLSLAKLVLTDPADIVAGEPITWGLDVGNHGPDAEAGPVTIVDTIPAGVVADSLADLTVAGPGWTAVSYDDASRSLTLERSGGVAAPSGGVAATIPRVTVTALVEPGLVSAGATTATLVNAATVSGTTDELEKGNNDDDASSTVRALADLELSKSAVTGSYTQGMFITWELDVTNHGPSVSRTQFTVTDTLPAEVDPSTLELLSGADWSVVGGAPVGGVVTFAYDGTDLGVDDVTSTLRFRVQVRSDLLTEDPIVNEATVNPTTPDPVDPNNDDDAPVGHGTALADLSLAKSLASDDLVAGERGRYRIEVENTGPSYAVDVVVTDSLPEGLTYDGGLESQIGDTWVLDSEVVNPDGTSSLTFVLDSGSGMLPDGDSTWFEFDVEVASWLTAAVTNVADVSSSTPDPDPDNNEDEEPSTPLVQTNLSIAKVHDDAVRRVGDDVVFTVTVTNHGPADAEDVEIADALPAGLTFEGLTDVSEATDGRSWTHAVVDDELSATLSGSLAAGQTAVVEITATLTPASFPSVTNTVTVDTSTDETSKDDNVADDPVPVDSPDLRVAKTAAADSVQGGDELTYTIVVTNHGGAHADEVTLSDALPAELEYLTSVWDTSDASHAWGDVCEITGATDGLGGTLDCVLPDGLAAGQSATLLVTLAVPADVAVDSVTNTVTVASDDEDPSLRGDNDDEETTPVRWMSVTAQPACVLDTPWLGFDVELHNVAVGGTLVLEWFADADGDGAPDGAAIHSATVAVSQGDLISGRVLWPGTEVDEHGIATLLPGYRATKHGETATWQNLVEDSSLPEHALRDGVVVKFSINPEQSVGVAYPAATEDCLVARDTTLEITKSADAERVDAGDELTYTIEVRNTGNGAARDVVVTDSVPEQLKVERVLTAKPGSADAMPWTECTVAGEDSRGYGGTVTCELDGVLARGQVAPLITIVTTVDPEAETGDVVNVAEVEWTSADGDEDTGVAEDDAQVEVRGEEDLAVTGADLLRVLGIAVALVMAGAVLVLVVRARRV